MRDLDRLTVVAAVFLAGLASLNALGVVQDRAPLPSWVEAVLWVSLACWLIERSRYS